MAEDLEKEDVVSGDEENILHLDWEQLRELSVERLREIPPYLLAQVLDQLDLDQKREILRKLTPQEVSEIVAEMDAEDSAELLGAMRDFRAVGVLEHLDPDDAADVVDEMEDEDRVRLLKKLDPETAQVVEDLLRYDSETAGGIMTPDVAEVNVESTVDEAIQRIRALNEEIETIYYVYVTDANERLLGVVSMRELILAKPWQKMDAIMESKGLETCLPNEDRESVAHKIINHNLVAIPVVNESGVLLGIVTHDDVMDILQEEATEDFQKFSGAGGDERLSDDVIFSVKRRYPWLQFNLVTAFMAASVVMCFEEEIGRHPILAGFMPIIAGVGGNSGQQALAVAIRSIATGDFHQNDVYKIIGKQMAIGSINGLAIGVIAGIIAWFISHDLNLSYVVTVAMVLNMVLAGLMGAMIPIVLKKIGKDPAQSSSIFLTAATDTGGFLIFLSIASFVFWR